MAICRSAVGLALCYAWLMGRSDELGFGWVVTLRWAAILGQIATILIVEFAFPFELPLLELGAVIGVEAASNLLAARLFAGRRSALAVAGVMTLDLLCLTGLLYLTGGPHNPFNFLYLVYIALAAVVLSPPWAWSLTALSVLLCGLLFAGHRPVVAAGHAGHEGHGMDMALHTSGMWVALAVAAVFISYFTTRVRALLAVRDAELAAAREHAVNADRLAALATLAAGAAHQLGTPLSTIAVVARELEHTLAEGPDCGEDATSDARLIREEVGRCRAVLDQMALEAGEAGGEAPSRVLAGAWLRDAVGRLARADRVDLDLCSEVESAALSVYPRALEQALGNVVRNALQASPDRASVTLRARCVGPVLQLEVADRGAGMAADALARATEPFFTTRPPGEGMGLGLFLARTVAERTGGCLRLRSEPGSGTSVTLELPLDPAGGSGGPDD